MDGLINYSVRKYVLSLCIIIFIDQMIKNLLNLFFPKVCVACHHLLTDNEEHICTSCRHELPLTNYHFEGDDPVKKVFYGRVNLERATALFRFQKKGKVQMLLHNLKYRGHERISEFLGSWLGSELAESTNYKNVDIVIPVPIHKQKRRTRGYNQVTKFGEQIAKSLGAEFNESILVKKNRTATKVFKERRRRWDRSEESLDLINAEELSGKHILLVDDLITTGATIEACSNVLLKAQNIKLSVASMAIAE